MAEVTVEQLAKTVGTDAAKLLSQMKDAGLPHKKPDEAVSDDDKRTLLSHLKRSHGSTDEAPRKITLKRKSVSTLKTGGSAGKRTVNVEVRKKRTYVKRPEIEEAPEHAVIGLITEWTDQDGQVEQRDTDSDLGGTMRLGEQACVLNQGTLAQRVYNDSVVHERHRHRYEVNNRYVDQLVDAGLVVAGRSEDGELVEMVELADHPWFLACQFHPEFTSSPRKGHPLFQSFVEAGLSHAANAHASHAAANE